MDARRLQRHPVLPIAADPPSVPFTWNQRPMFARPGESLAAALAAHGVRGFGSHPRDGTPQGLFCANGQCSQCLVRVDGLARKACITPVQAGMAVEPHNQLPDLPLDDRTYSNTPPAVVRVPVLVVGAGPAGLSAAAELGALGIDTLVVDDKPIPGGKLVLQTHRFFGSVAETHAGTRGIDIARLLAEAAVAHPEVSLRLGATAVGVFADGRIGMVDHGRYTLVEPHGVLFATGAREKQVPFPGHTLPGVLGAGAFQTLLNRDQVLPGRRLLILGGGNVGLIAAWHAVQAGIEVAGVVEAMPQVGGYEVHADKLRRLGVPIYLSHTILAAHGRAEVEAATIAPLDARGHPQPDGAWTIAVDTVLVAAGLAPLDELHQQAKRCGLQAVAAGDAAEVSEASAAVFGGRIAARQLAARIGVHDAPIPPAWEPQLAALRSRPGARHPPAPLPDGAAAFPVFRCDQEIPCNPCAHVCPHGSIELAGDPLLGLPRFVGGDCSACARCVAACPGQAITLVDARPGRDGPSVVLPFEILAEDLHVGDRVIGVDARGDPIGEFAVVEFLNRKGDDRTRLVRVQAGEALPPLLAGIRLPGLQPAVPRPAPLPLPAGDDAIVCRCERVTAGRIRAEIRRGVRDVNQLKAALRLGMGACGGRTCLDHVLRIFREEGVSLGEVTPATLRPLFVEVEFGALAGQLPVTGPPL